MLRILLPLILVLGVAGWATPRAAPAAVPNNTYSVTVPVAGTSDAQRNTAIGVALADVLQRVAPGFVASPDVLAQASGYVRSYRYRRAASGSGLELRVDFDSGAVDRLVAAGQKATAARGGTAQPGNTVAPAAMPVAQGGSGSVWVGGIDNTRQFAKLLATLRGDSALHDVIPVATHGNGLMLQVGFDQPLATILAGMVGAGGHLAYAVQPHPGAEASLRWVP